MQLSSLRTHAAGRLCARRQLSPLAPLSSAAHSIRCRAAAAHGAAPPGQEAAAHSKQHARAVATKQPASPDTITARKRQALTRARKEALRLFLGPLHLVEQRFRVGRGVAGRLRKQAGQEGEGTGANAGSQHPHEFVLVAPGDVDEVIDLYFERQFMDADPYWVRAWPSALALATAVLDSPELVRGKRVADLGAGLGVAGIAAALAGAREVVLLDREPLALQCALASAVMTLRDRAKVTGLQVSDPQHSELGNRSPATNSSHTNESSSSSSSSSSSNSSPGSAAGTGAALASQQLISLSTSSVQGASSDSSSSSSSGGGGGAAFEGEGQYSKAEAHRLWGHVPLPSFWFHGPDLSRVMSHSCASTSATHSEQQHSSSSSSSSTGGGNSGSSSSGNGPHIWGFPLDWHSQDLLHQLVQQFSGSAGRSSRDSRSNSSMHHSSADVGNRASSSEAGSAEPPSSSASTSTRTSAEPPFDVVLACDVLYEAAAVKPIARILPQLLRPQSGTLLLADPPNRTVANRERFMRLVAGGSDEGDEDDESTNGVRRRLQLSVKQQWTAPCYVHDLDSEMVGGLSAQGTDQAPVLLHIMKSSLGPGEDTVGLKF